MKHLKFLTIFSLFLWFACVSTGLPLIYRNSAIIMKNNQDFKGLYFFFFSDVSCGVVFSWSWQKYSADVDTSLDCCV